MKMPVFHLFITLCVVCIWGVNFLFVKIGLEELPPLLLCSLRFLMASIPVIFFVKPPRGHFRDIISYGLLMFALQFSLFFIGMFAGMTPGMASLLMQIQVFFSMFFAALILKERPKKGQVLGALVAFSGIGIVALHFDKDISAIGFFCIMGSAATWGLGNLVGKKIARLNMSTVVVWGSFTASIPLTFAALIFDGVAGISQSLHHISARGFIALLYIVVMSTWMGYGLWNWLLGRYPVTTIVPFTLLVPVVGMLTSVLFYHEILTSWKIASILLVVSGLVINILSTRQILRFPWLKSQYSS